MKVKLLILFSVLLLNSLPLNAALVNTQTDVNHVWVTAKAEQHHGDPWPYQGKSKAVAVLLAIFFGYLGAHRFYLGNELTSSGYLQLTYYGLSIVMFLLAILFIDLGIAETAAIFIIIGVILALTNLITWIVDVFKLLANKPLKPLDNTPSQPKKKKRKGLDLDNELRG